MTIPIQEKMMVTRKAILTGLLLFSVHLSCTSLMHVGLPRRDAILTASTVVSQSLWTAASTDGAKSTTKNGNNNAADWGPGTSLPHLSPVKAVANYCTSSPPSSNGGKTPCSGDGPSFPMARWPDPVLRIPARPVPSHLFNAAEFHQLADALRRTSRDAGAVGLAAQQCGIDASLVFLEDDDYDRGRSRWSPTFVTGNSPRPQGEGIFLVNPRFVYRSPEEEMLVWEERCLVLPPDFRATVMRDRRVTVEAETIDGTTRLVDLRGELARAVQHECQHDEGILIIDHVDLDDASVVPPEMRRAEERYHDERQRRAFARDVVNPTVGSVGTWNVQERRSLAKLFDFSDLGFIPPARAATDGMEKVDSACDQRCRERLAERRALFNQSRSTKSRQEIFELSRQRAALYNTTYQGTSCLPGIPCI